MNSATGIPEKRGVQRFNSHLTLERGLVLFIGRKRQVITQDARFEMLREYGQYDFTGTARLTAFPIYQSVKSILYSLAANSLRLRHPPDIGAVPCSFANRDARAANLKSDSPRSTQRSTDALITAREIEYSNA